jgi:hypothetical protein
VDVSDLAREFRPVVHVAVESAAALPEADVGADRDGIENAVVGMLPTRDDGRATEGRCGWLGRR